MSEMHTRRDENDAGPETADGHFRILDLHDEVGQLLTAILANLQRLGNTASGTRLHGTIRDTQDLVENLYYTIRTYVRGVRPRRAPVPALLPALEKMAVAFTRRTGIGVLFRCGCNPELLPGEHRTVLYRVVQECLTNVFRHSTARSVTIAFNLAGAAIRLEVVDDGGGGRTREKQGAATSGEGTGLRGIRERVRLIGGDCSVSCVDGRGMSVSVTIPYNIS